MSNKPVNSSSENIQDISVIMPVYNGIGFIEKSLPPLVTMLENKEILELIVIDDGSLDNSVEIAEKFGARIMSTGGRKGPGAGRNIAAEEALGSILWFIDADVIVKDDAAKILKEGFIEKEVVAVFGSYDDTPAAPNFLSQFKNMVHHYYHQSAKKEASTFWSGCGAVRKQNFLDLGGFDVEQFKHPSVEDIELGYRLLGAGGRIHLLTNLQSTHLKVWKFVNLIHTEIFRRALPWSRLMIKQNNLTNDLNVSKGERIRALLAGLLLLSIFIPLIDISFWWMPCIILLITLLSNAKFISFFYQRKGLLFSINSFLYQQFYYLYSSSAYVWAFLENKLSKAIGNK